MAGLLRKFSFSRRSRAPVQPPVKTLMQPSVQQPIEVPAQLVSSEPEPPAAYEALRAVQKLSESTSLGLTLESCDNITRVKSLVPYCAAEQAGLCVGDVVKTINGIEVDCATFGCTLLKSAPPGIVEIVVSTTASPSQPILPKEPAPVMSAFDDEIELLPFPSKVDISCAPKLVASYDRELDQLDAMGFIDHCAARCALREHGGDVGAAAMMLLAHEQKCPSPLCVV